MHVVHHAADLERHRPFVLPVRVYYEDTDAAGVVYYANYLKFLERARTEWLRAAGFEQTRLLKERGLVFMVRAVQADYLKPALLDDLLTVVSQVERIGRASAVFSQRVRRGEGEHAETLFDAQITVACVHWDRKKSAPIPPDVRDRLEALQ
jgi:acyl-CoA thioester hydrolase